MYKTVKDMVRDVVEEYNAFQWHEKMQFCFLIFLVAGVVVGVGNPGFMDTVLDHVTRFICRIIQALEAGLL